MTRFALLALVVLALTANALPTGPFSRGEFEVRPGGLYRCLQHVFK